MNWSVDETTLKIPKDYPKFQEGSRLLHFPTLTYTPRPLTEQQKIILMHARPYLDDPETLFGVIDDLMLYYRDELTP